MAWVIEGGQSDTRFQPSIGKLPAKTSESASTTLMSIAAIARIIVILLALLCNTAWAESFEEGMDAINEGDHETALEIMQPLAEMGHAQAQAILGLMHHKGDGVSKDNSKSARWFRAAAEQGHAAAQYNLGVMYSEGQGVTQDYSEAMRWYRAAAEQGYSSAQYNLGDMYRKGEEVSQDYSEAINWFRAAAKQGHAMAQGKLGALHVMGKGVIQDNIAAHMWVNIASANGAQGAREFRNKIARTMTQDEIAKAQSRARTCMESGYQDCD